MYRLASARCLQLAGSAAIRCPKRIYLSGAYGGSNTSTTSSITATAIRSPLRHASTIQHQPRTSSSDLTCLAAQSLSCAKQPDHVSQIASQLQETGILKISLQFPDPDSQYLEHLLLSLHKHHGHQLPIEHSALQGWFWDVRPSSNTHTRRFQSGSSHQARSETMNEFPWHTDCSYEDPPPRFFALHVLQHDRYGGGTLSLMNVARLGAHLSSETLDALSRPEFVMTIPPEFKKDPSLQSIVGSVLTVHDGEPTMRFREDILEPATERAARALAELRQVIGAQHGEKGLGDIQSPTMHLSADQLPAGSIVLVNNRRWLHARNHINDPDRHLRRVRWDAVPFGATDTA
jgi:alpha-ketoglutarate-dependent taurine dioxygenase